MFSPEAWEKRDAVTEHGHRVGVLGCDALMGVMGGFCESTQVTQRRPALQSNPTVMRNSLADLSLVLAPALLLALLVANLL